MLRRSVPESARTEFKKEKKRELFLFCVFRRPKQFACSLFYFVEDFFAKPFSLSLLLIIANNFNFISMAN
jgi:hypothetical protein